MFEMRRWWDCRRPNGPASLKNAESTSSKDARGRRGDAGHFDSRKEIRSFKIRNRYIRNLAGTAALPKKQARMVGMATLSTAGFNVPAMTHPAVSGKFTRKPRRQITPKAGKALEKLGHAIEYLTDEFVQSGASFSSSNPQLEAVQLLMALNRRVYFECPEVPTLGARMRGLLHRVSN